MPDTLTEEAVKAIVAEAVKGLDEKILTRDKTIADLELALKKADEETDRITKNRDSVLREKRALEGRKPPEQKSGEPTADDFILTRAEARDVQKYRRTKEAAKKAGFELRIVDNETTGAHDTDLPDRFENDERIFFSHVFMREGGAEAYRAAKAEAAQAGKVVQIVTSRSQLPKEAFDHA